MSTGYDDTDVKELEARGSRSGNTPSVLNAAVAVLLCLAIARSLHEGPLKTEI
jgi:lactate dehydrogenase-like 2-hydroxyacid dehydrogenase